MGKVTIGLEIGVLLVSLYLSWIHSIVSDDLAI
jgi:hypothetical protein